ncbi:serine/threonine-protein phosphatase 7 long form homolog [Manihot esculenta]|uniref:serine/threonine-protein phosphatase 7 long form homolog n=1 Tax=Manihot esculenta TaxID=3983 RepID=UPI001CC65B73|nr:serine/threonine-protein phosphatase 7 long form homolog [Manihot esculenta]
MTYLLTFYFTDMTGRQNYHDYTSLGPLDQSLLTQQQSHGSQSVWNEEIENEPLLCRQSASVLKQNFHPRIEAYLRISGFYGAVKLGYFSLDHHLITSLVERWRPETHTFMMPVGECTITLQDICVISGLPIDGDAVVGNSIINWMMYCQNTLGLVPPTNIMQGSSLPLSWLVENFNELPDDTDEEVMVWEPYSDELLASLPLYCMQGRDIWRAVVPLICFHVVEWHQPDRVLRQFGMQQPIPHPPYQPADLHNTSLLSSDSNWITIHAHWIAIWEDRWQRLVEAAPLHGPLHYHSEYLEWYRRVSHRWISHRGAAIGTMVNLIERQTTAMFYAMEEEKRITKILPPQPAPRAQPMPNDPEEPVDPPRRPRRRRSSRQQANPDVYTIVPANVIIPAPVYSTLIDHLVRLDSIQQDLVFHKKVYHNIQRGYMVVICHHLI